MGQDHRPDKALSTRLIVEILSEAEARIFNAPSVDDANWWVVFGSYVAFLYVMSLQGSESLLLDLKGLRELNTDSRHDYLVAVLYGKLKGETHDHRHLIPVVRITGSGISLEMWLKWLLMIKAKEGHTDGPAISDGNGRVLTSRSLDDLLHEVLEDLFESQKNLFSPDVTSLEKLREKYHIFRSLKCAANTRAVDMNVSKSDKDVVSRWEAKEKAGGKKASGPMTMYYAEFDLLIGPFMRYGKAM
jgi:hypothetical protein